VPWVDFRLKKDNSRGNEREFSIERYGTNDVPELSLKALGD